MQLNKISKQFNGKLLIWGNELKKLRASTDTQVEWHVNGQCEKVFTKDSVLTAINNRKGYLKTHTGVKYKSYYVVLDYSVLEEVKPPTNSFTITVTVTPNQ